MQTNNFLDMVTNAEKHEVALDEEDLQNLPSVQQSSKLKGACLTVSYSHMDIDMV